MPILARSLAGAATLVICTLVASFTHEAKSEIKLASDGDAALSARDPCKLLVPGEVETILGPLAGPPYRASGTAAKANGTDCRYETAAGRSIRVSVMWEDGAQFIGMMGAMADALKTAGLSELKLSDGSTVAGAWDRAHVNQCCEFNALRGDRLVTIDVAASRASIGQGAALADAAVRRVDQPLTIDGGAGVASAQQRAAQRPKPRSVCDVVTRADAEAIAGSTLLAPPKGDEDSCSYAWDLAANGSRYTIKLMMQWKDGFHELRQASSMIGQASSMLGLGPQGGQPSSDSVERRYDEFSRSIVGVMAVKSDVLASVESGPYRQDIAEAFVEKAMANLMK
jgi:hypothetical protein